MKKAKLLVTMLLALVMSFALIVFASCVEDTPIDTGSTPGTSDTGSGDTTVDETAPVITLSTDATEATVFTGMPYSLPTATAEDETDGPVAVSITASAGTVEEGVFTADEEGVYTITYTAVDAAENKAEKTFTVNVKDDEIAPVITLSTQETVFTATLGTDFTLPTATVTDNIDSADEIFCDVFSDPSGAVKNGVFNSNVLGAYTVTYYAVDTFDNETYYDITVNVTSETYAETTDITGYEDINALNNDGGVFKENFAKGLNSPLIKGAMQVGSIQAGENALNGNSIVMDYNALEGKANEFFLSNLSPYLRSGKWTVTFDVKLVSGTGFSDFYFGYVKEGTIDSADQNYSLADMKVGDVKTITYSQLISLDPESTYWFHFFQYKQDAKAVVAFDNFTFKYEAKIYTETTPTFDELKAGYTYDWTNNYMAMSASEPEKISEITNAEAKAAIEGASAGFSDTVMHLTGSGQHNLSVLDKSKNPEFFQVGYIYTFEFSYYAASNEGNYMIVLDGTSSNNAFWSGPFQKGLNTAKRSYTISSGDYMFTFYGAMDVYLGNLKITVSEPIVERTDYAVPTDEQMLAEGGYTWDWSENNIAKFRTYNYAEISKMEDAALATALTATGSFTEGYALLFNAHNNLDGMDGKLTAGNKYTITVNAYVVSGGNNFLILFMSEAWKQVGMAEFTATNNENGTTTFTTTFTAAEGYTSIYFYANGTVELYIADINITEALPAANLVEKTVTGSVAWANCGAGQKHIATPATPEGAVGKEGFAENCLQFDGSRDVMELTNVMDVLRSYENLVSVDITFYYYVDTLAEGRLLYAYINGGFLPLTSTVGYHKETVTVKTSGAFEWICLHISNGTLVDAEKKLYTADSNFYLGSFDYVITYMGEPEPETETPTLVEKTVSGTKAWSECGAGKKHIDTPFTPEGAYGKEGFDERCLQFDGSYDIMELVQDLYVENMVSIELTFYYYVVDTAGRQLYVMLDYTKVGDNETRYFAAIDSSAGYHTATVTFAADKINYVCLHINGTVADNSEFYLGGFDYVITYMGEAE